MNHNLSWFTQTATFRVAIVLIALWAISGPFFDFSDTWQLVINTVTTIITFLMVFLIQNTQSRDKEALPIKLDERLRALEDLDDEELEVIRKDYLRLARSAQAGSCAARITMLCWNWKKKTGSPNRKR